jgi:hypothetical protein
VQDPDVSDDLPARRSDALPATGVAEPALELHPGMFSRENWQLVLSEDGWYLCESHQAPRRVSVGDAVAKIGKFGRSPVLKASRQYVAELGRRIAEEAWLSPTAPRRLRDYGLDPKLPSDQIARAGHIIGRLGDELSRAEGASPII